MISQNLKEMNLPSNHQKDTQSSVYVADMVFSVSDVKAATLLQVRMKVDMVREPSEPHETNGELVLRGEGKVQGRNKNIAEMYQQVSPPVTTTIVVMKCVVEMYRAVKYAEVEDMLGTPAFTRASTNYF